MPGRTALVLSYLLTALVSSFGDSYQRRRTVIWLSTGTRLTYMRRSSLLMNTDHAVSNCAHFRLAAESCTLVPERASLPPGNNTTFISFSANGLRCLDDPIIISIMFDDTCANFDTPRC